jgi:hypothetical protein
MEGRCDDASLDWGSISIVLFALRTKVRQAKR